MRKVFNFNAGPAMLPEEVLLTAQGEMLDWHGCGMSIMELGHRGPEFQQVAAAAEKSLRELMAIPEHYQVLFLPGGATTQFAMVPLNLLARNNKVDYVDTGIWSKKAIAEAERYGQVNIAAKCHHGKEGIVIPSQQEWHLQPDVAYLHYTPNETIEGIEFHFIPETGDVPLVADVSSMILSQPIDVNRFGILYAGAQKNLGQAGVTIVIIRNDLIGEAMPFTPTLYQYKVLSANHSFYNTPPTYSWYLTGLVLDWIKRQGGVETIYAINQRKAKKLYAAIDESNGFYCNNIDPKCRSLTNVVFTLKDDTLQGEFLKQANEAGLVNLRGHKVVGGLRASIYNAMPEQGIDLLVTFMREFTLKY